MSAQALPCIVCGSELPNVTEDADNQPEGGTAFTTHGHYGSTAFDPMDGQFLEINICDDCLQAAQERSRVYWSRDWRPVLYGRMVVGRERVTRPYVLWNGEGTDDDEVDVVHLNETEVGEPLSKNLEWFDHAVEYVKRQFAEEDAP